MATLKTQITKASALGYVKEIPDTEKRNDCIKLLKLFQEITGEKPKMWGSSIIGFGTYHYKSERSTQEGDWPITGFSPRKQNITLYLTHGFKDYEALLTDLGKHKTSVGCLYIKKLSDVNIDILSKLIKRTAADMRKKYPESSTNYTKTVAKK